MKRLVAIMVLCAVLSACRVDTFEPLPASFDATYALQSVNNVPLPATAARGGGEHYILLGDTLRFTRSGSVHRSLVYRHISTQFWPADTVYRYRLTLEYTVTGSRLVIGRLAPCPPNANCIGTDEGRITVSEATVRGRMHWPGEPLLRFRRVSDERSSL